VKKLVPENWELVFETNTSLHYTNERTETLDAYFGRLDENLQEIEGGLVRQLEDKVVAEHQKLFYEISKRLGELDAYMSFAEVSAAGGYARPKIVKESVLYVKNARNPLQELALQGRALSSAGASSSFVPNDIALAPGVARAGPIAILTGPNGSGKSVYLRTVGILVLLSQAGCFVPAEKCVMGLVDRLFTRILSQEAASALGLSSFTIDVNAIGSMCRHATPRSLLLIDEFGKGTNCIDGVSLLCATVRYFLKCQSPPKIVITTRAKRIM
jgi:DNA mismatch repair protein MSH5